MNGDNPRPGGGAPVHKAKQALARILIVHAQSALEGDRAANGVRHSRQAIGHQIGLSHQGEGRSGRSAPASEGQPTLRLAILVVAKVLADPRRGRQFLGRRPAQLESHGMLRRIEPEQPGPIAMDHRRGREHLAVEPRALQARRWAMEGPAMAIRPVHHRRDAQSICLFLHHFYRISTRSRGRNSASVHGLTTQFSDAVGGERLRAGPRAVAGAEDVERYRPFWRMCSVCSPPILPATAAMKALSNIPTAVKKAD